MNSSKCARHNIKLDFDYNGNDTINGRKQTLLFRSRYYSEHPFLFPRLNEQKRIVAAVNQLMALCDELQANLRRAEEDGERLLRAPVCSLLASVSEISATEAAALVV